MRKSQTFPAYLPSMNRRLEYQAGLFMPAALLEQLPAEKEKQLVRAEDKRQWLGEDFSHVIVTRAKR